MLSLFIAAAVFLFVSRQNLLERQREALISASVLAEARQHENDFRNRIQLRENAEQLLSRAAAQRLTPDSWAERRVNLRQALIPRNEVNELLLSIVHTEKRSFVVDEFELAVTRDDDSLFHESAHPNTPLLLTVHGTLVFHTGKEE